MIHPLAEAVFNSTSMLRRSFSLGLSRTLTRTLSPFASALKSLFGNTFEDLTDDAAAPSEPMSARASNSSVLGSGKVGPGGFPVTLRREAMEEQVIYNHDLNRLLFMSSIAVWMHLCA